MAQNSIPSSSPQSDDSQNPLPESVYGLQELNQTWKNPQNPNLIIQNSQNPNANFQNSQNPYANFQNSQNLNDFMFQNQLISQNLHQNRYLMRELQQPPRYLMNNYSSLGLNPSFGELASLQEAMSRVNLLDQYSQQQSLNRMRSVHAGLGLLRPNPNPYMNLNPSFQNRANRPSATPHGRWAGFSPVTENLSQYGSGGFRADSVQRIPSLYGLGSRENSVIHYSLDLDQLKGRLVNVSKTHEGSRFLLQKLDEKRPDQFDLIFSELKDHVCELVVNQFANGLFQKLFGFCNEQQMAQLLLILINDEQKLLNICVNQHGTRVVQKMIDCMKIPEQRLRKQRFILVSALKYITVPLCKNNNGHHIIQQCLKCFSVDDTKCLVNEIANSCLEIAMDKRGCCVLQIALFRAEGDLQNRLLADVIANALVLSEHPYGNYVVQFVLQEIPHARASIVERLMGNFVTLSMNKFASNVVEKCIKFCSDNNAVKVIQELMRSRDFLDVIQDSFGNYVIQTAIKTYKGEVFCALARVIDHYYPYLHSHLHGKKVLEDLAVNRKNKN